MQEFFRKIKFLKNLQKSVDKWGNVWYSIKAVARQG